MNKRIELLLASKSLFANKGFAQTSIRDISDKSKVNSSMISYYFGSKNGLLVGIFDEFFPSTKIKNSSVDIEGNLRNLLKTILILRKNDPELIDILHSEIILKSSRLKDIKQYIQPFWDELRNQLTIANDTGEFKIKSVDVSYLYILACISFPYHNKIFFDNGELAIMNETFIDELIETIIKGIR
ncbi:MAG: TetR family transcriptional regulator [Spirochaetaceae bacterium]